MVLVGASVRPGDDLFLTIDHDLRPGEPPLPPDGSGADAAAIGPGNLEDHLGDSDDALIGATRAQMLAYLALRSAPASQLRTVPVPTDRTSRRRRSGLTTPLEDDRLTLAMRADVRGATTRTDPNTLRADMRSMGLDDFLSCRIPGTEVHLGMSRRLFAACERLHEEDLAIAQRTPGLRAEDQPAAANLDLSDKAQEEQRLTQRRIFREQQEEARPRLRPLLRDAYERGATSDWRELLRRPQEPELDLEGDEGLLEAATPETYLAVSRYDLPPARS
ncbi:hypothetical protein ACGFYA_22530 [Streptomyces sp. NPDC048305]|uniref:hypothetical protein n=1 Tax=Streptomyces sp. NPDC048305 TaxID=3365532 RepID=UPI003722CF3E